MTHSIHSADAERELPPLPETDVTYEDGKDEWGYTDYSSAYSAKAMADYVRADRAAAQVGAKGSAPVTEERIDTWINGIGGGTWKDGALTLRRDELVAVIRGIVYLAAGAPAETPKPDALARMAHDFPALQAFHTKHALGPMLAPSCLCCGQQTHPLTRPVAIKHGELPGIVVCAVCRDAAATPAATIGAGEGKDAARVQFLIDHPHWSVRWRIQTKKQIQQWQMVDDGEPWGQWGEYRAVVDAARTAIRSKTSPAEAG